MWFGFANGPRGDGQTNKACINQVRDRRSPIIDHRSAITDQWSVKSGSGVENAEWAEATVRWCLDWWRLNRQSNARYTHNFPLHLHCAIDRRLDRWNWNPRSVRQLVTTLTFAFVRILSDGLANLTDWLIAWQGLRLQGAGCPDLGSATPEWCKAVTLTYVLVLSPIRRSLSAFGFYAKWRWPFACQSLDKCCQLWATHGHVDHD